jgi:L-threonylcarbamoyladenylate synthase
VSQLEAIVGPVGLPDAERPAAILKSPGQLERHYAPRTPLEVAPDDGSKRVEMLREQGLRVGWLTFTGTELPNGPGVVMLRLPSDNVGYAAQLYAALHQLDDAGVDRIIVSQPPDTEEWLAVRDRLQRARGSRRFAKDCKG